MRNHFALGVIVGSVALCLCQWLQYWGGYLIYVPFGVAPTWRFALFGVLVSVATLLPGVLAGFISMQRGFVAGALVGAVGSVLYGVFFELIQAHSGAIHINAHTWTILFTFPSTHAAALIIGSAVGGGAGQLLRSNNRWSGHES